MSFAAPTVTPERSAQMRDASVRPTAPIGTSGKPLYGGRVYGFEHNTRLQGPQKLMEAYRKAERNPAVASGWACMKGLALSARWDVQAANDSDLAQRCADHARTNLGIGRTRNPLGRSWEGLLSEFLLSQIRGFGVWDLVCPDDSPWTRVRWFDPASVAEWIVDDMDRLVGIRQGATWLTGGAEIPASRLLYLARENEGTNFEGVGLLRSIEPLCRDQDRALQSLAAAVQRWSLGTPEATMDREEWRKTNPGNSDQAWADEGARWERLLKSYMSYERNYIVRDKWVTLGTYGGSLNSGDFEGAVNLYHRLILTAFLAQFLMLGSSGSGGAYSLAQTHADVAVQAAENMLDGVRDALNTSLIPRMCRWGVDADVSDDDLPTLTFTGLRAPLWVERMAEIPALFQGLGITPQTPIEAQVLDELGFDADAVDRTPGERLRGMAPGRPPAAPPPGPVAIRPAPVTP